MSELDDLLERTEKLSRANFELKQANRLQADLVNKAQSETKKIRRLLRRSSDWFKANYSYIQDDEDTMQLWIDIDDSLPARELEKRKE